MADNTTPISSDRQHERTRTMTRTRTRTGTCTRGKYFILPFAMLMMILLLWRSKDLLRPYSGPSSPFYATTATTTITNSVSPSLFSINNSDDWLNKIQGNGQLKDPKNEKDEKNDINNKEHDLMVNNTLIEASSRNIVQQQMEEAVYERVDLYSLLANVTMYNTSVLYKDKFGTEKELLDRYKAKNAPFAGGIIRSKRRQSTSTNNDNSNDNNNKIRVRVLLFKGSVKIRFREGPTSLIGDEVLNICMDGFERSPYFDMLPAAVVPPTISDKYILPEDDDTTWVIDMRRMLNNKPYSIPEQLWDVLQNTNKYYEEKQQQQKQQQQQQQQQRNSEASFRMPNIQVIFWDWSDRVHDLCRRHGHGRIIKQFEDLLGSPYNVRQFQQQVTYGRKWIEKNKFSSPSHIFPNFGDCYTYPTLHMPYVVRSDYVEMVLELYPKFLPTSATKTNTTTTTTAMNTTTNSSFIIPDDHPSYTIRPLDVAHFWPFSHRSQKAELRNSVTVTIQQLQNNTIIIPDHELRGQQQQQQRRRRRRRISVIADSVSSAGNTGRTSAQTAYMEAMLTTKIVVVAQRDAWEDHYRYFEAIVGGPLVLTDPMATLPDGYINGTNVIVYRSLKELKHYIIYYLEHPMERIAIAKRGWDLAISRHRTYHWMEELFFGRPLSK